MPSRTRTPLLALLLALAAPLGAQQPAAPPLESVGDTSIFAPLALLPSPSEIRLGSGAPGPGYWQNRADYELQATLDTATHTVRGRLRLRYTNNSPEPLSFVWFQLEQNAFRGDALNALYYAADSRHGARGFEGGDVIDRFEQVVGERSVAVKRREHGTMMKVDLAEPLATGQTATLEVEWHFAVPEHGADRMGRDGALYEIAQWYPRVAVYDDVSGWNTEPYLGKGEFYLDYGNYDLAVTVPAGYVVAATGVLLNPQEVLSPAQAERLQRAKGSTRVVNVVTAADRRDAGRASGTRTWRFHAENVRDAVFAASPDYLWDAVTWNGVLAQAFYRPSAAELWREAADMSRASIQEYSERWFPYPYPQVSAVEGPVSGMEYPMVAMESRGTSRYDLYEVITHEIGHNWFPMIVGSNERVYMWQDEGFNQWINTFAEAERYPERGSQEKRAGEVRSTIEEMTRRGVPLVVNIPPDRLDQQFGDYASYFKPLVGLQMLREDILGHEAFDDAFRTYIRRWAFKHPTPADFFRTMEDVSGEDLDWFWREWFLEDTRFDQAIDTVATRMEGKVQRVGVAYGNRARGVLPIRVRFTFGDGTTEDFTYPAIVWAGSPERYIRYYEFPGKRVARIELDPDEHLIDLDRSNNVWTPGS